MPAPLPRPSRSHARVLLAVSLVLALVAGATPSIKGRLSAHDLPPLPIPTAPPVIVPEGNEPPPLPDSEREPVRARPEPVVQETDIALPTARADGPSQALASAPEETDKASAFTSVYDYGTDTPGADHLADVALAPQNYRDEAGAWKKIDPYLIPAKGGYSNAAGPVPMFFPDQLSPASPVTLTVPQGTISSYPIGASDTATVTVHQNRITYGDAYPGTDLSYATIATGYWEDVILKAPPSADHISWSVLSPGLTMRLEPNGSISILSGLTLVGSIPAPTVADSNLDPETGLGASSAGFSYSLTGVAGAYQLDLVYDKSWLNDPSRVYPVTVDPGPQQTVTGSEDTWTKDCSPGDGHPLSQELLVGSGSSCSHFSYVRFDTDLLSRSNRIIYDGILSLCKIEDGTSGNEVKLQRISSSSPAIYDIDYAHRPPVDSQVWDSTALHVTGSGPTCPAWQNWPRAGGLLSEVLDSANPHGWNDNGFHLAATNFHRFASADTTLTDPDTHELEKPTLQFTYDDLPPEPTAAGPIDGKTVVVDSPLLSVSSIPTDPNGDPVVIQFEISTAEDFSSIVTRSPLLSTTAWYVDAGVLHDGQKYWWRAVTYDVCSYEAGTGNPQVCSNIDAERDTAYPNGREHPRGTSTARNFTMALSHRGTDDRWAMWSDGLGNGMGLQVN